MHYPVINKKGDTIASALTTIDLHDIARVAKTFGVRKFYVVTPFQDQKNLLKSLIIKLHILWSLVQHGGFLLIL